MTNGIGSIDFAIAAVLVVLYAWFRYATPPTVRTQTTWEKFLVGRLSYVLVFFVIFVAIIASPAFLAALLGLQGLSPEVSSWIERYGKELSPPLVAAFVLTVFLSEIPIFTKWDRAVRSYFHRVSAIPGEQRRWARRVRHAKIVVNAKVRSRLARRFEAQGLTEDDLEFERSDSLRHLWTRATLFVDRLDALKGERKYDQCLGDPEYERLRTAYRRFHSMAAVCIKLPPAQPGEKAGALLHKEFTEQLRGFLDRMADFVSRMILRCGRTHHLRYGSLNSLSLKLVAPPAKKRLNVHEILWLAILVLVFASLTLSHLGPGLLLLIIFNYLLATVVAIVCNELRRQFTARREMGNLPPVGRYLLPGALTFLLASAATITFLRFTNDTSLLVERKGPVEAFVQIHWPWMLLNVFVAVTIAFLIGDWLNERRPAWHRRLDLAGLINPADGAIVGLGLALLSLLVVHPRFEPSVVTALELPSATTLALRTSVFGFVLGGFAPVRYRNALAREEALEKKEELEDLGDGAEAIPLRG